MPGVAAGQGGRREDWTKVEDGYIAAGQWSRVLTSPLLYLAHGGWLQPAVPSLSMTGGGLFRAGTWSFTMAARKKVLLKVIILGDSGYAHAHPHRHITHTHLHTRQSCFGLACQKLGVL